LLTLVKELSAAGVAAGIISDIKQEMPENAKIPPELPPEGFYIRIGTDQSISAGTDERGLLYGVYRFFVLLAQGRLKAGAEISEVPTTALHMLNHWDNLDGSIERGYAGLSFFYKDNRIEYDRERIVDYARLAASTGINRISINNVNVRQAAKLLITCQ
jgi:alpha-glucuronidase